MGQTIFSVSSKINFVSNTGVQMGGWFRNEIKSADDFKGIKMRIPGIGAEIVNQLEEQL